MCSWGWLGPVAAGRHLPPGPDLRELRDRLLGPDAAGGGSTYRVAPCKEISAPWSFPHSCRGVESWALGGPELLVGVPQPHPIHGFPVPQAQLLPGTLSLGTRPVAESPCRGLCMDSSHPSSCCLCMPPAPAQAAGQLKGLGSGGTHS